MESWAVLLPGSGDAQCMGITHCPLCIGLAVLSAARFMANAVMVLQLERRGVEQSTHAASLLGTVFEL